MVPAASKSRPAPAKERDLGSEMWQYVPWDFAIREWEALAFADKYPDLPVKHPKHEATECPTCGWPLAQRGFVRLWFPVGHRLFGKAVCCPACWPAPFGHAKSGYLSDKMLEIAEKWEKVLQGAR